jgi:hypothetical protein
VIDNHNIDQYQSSISLFKTKKKQKGTGQGLEVWFPAQRLFGGGSRERRTSPFGGAAE